MKLNKTILKEMIYQEIKSMEVGSTTGAEVRSAQADAAKAQIGAGIDDKERDFIRQFLQLVTGAARETNILSGAVATKLELIIPILQKIVGAQAGAPQQPTGEKS